MVTAAEFTGFIAPAVVGAVTANQQAGTAVPALLAAGAVEGSMLGWGQATVLRRVLPDLSRPRWIAATAGGAVLAYLAGSAPSTAHDARLSPVPFILVVAVAGVVLLLSLGGSQWFVLRHLVPRAGRWVAATAGAWMLGLVVFLGFTMPLWHAGQPLALIVLIGAAGGLLMAAVTSAVTGSALRWIVPTPRTVET